MTKFWFRICFERECDTKEDAEEFLDTATDNLWESDTMSDLNCEVEQWGNQELLKEVQGDKK